MVKKEIDCSYYNWSKSPVARITPGQNYPAPPYSPRTRRLWISLSKRNFEVRISFLLSWCTYSSAKQASLFSLYSQLCPYVINNLCNFVWVLWDLSSFHPKLLFFKFFILFKTCTPLTASENTMTRPPKSPPPVETSTPPGLQSQLR